MARLLVIDLWPDRREPARPRDRFDGFVATCAQRGDALTVMHFSDLAGAGAPPCDGMVLSGSPTNLVDDPAEDRERGATLAHFARVLALLDERETTPLLAICFGHQLIAKASGGRLAQLPRQRTAGNHPIQVLAADPLLAGLSAPAFAQDHQWSVASPGRGYAVVARSVDGIEMVRHAALPRVGVQFHPEYYARQAPAEPSGRWFLERWLESL